MSNTKLLVHMDSIRELHNIRKLDDYRESVFDSLKQKDKELIVKIQLDIQKHLIDIKYNFFTIGKLLSEAKAILPHGTYTRWIKETWGDELKESTAACFKAIYNKFKDHQEGVLLLPISLLQQMAQPTFPDEIIKLITDNAEAFKKTNVQAVKDAYRDFKEEKIDQSQFETLAAKQIEIGIAILEGRAYARNSLSGKRIIRSGFFNIREFIVKMQKYVGKIRGIFPAAELGELTSGVPSALDEWNGKVDDINEALNNGLIQEIDFFIDQLKELKVVVEDHQGFWRQRLVETDGIITKEEISNR